MTLHRATYDRPGWSVIRSEDGGRHWTPVSAHPTARSARAHIDSLTGALSPLRSERQIEPGTYQGADVSGAGAHFGAETLPGNGPVLPLPAPHSPEAALGRVRAGRSRREVGRAAER
jgi:hypothetical protein